MLSASNGMPVLRGFTQSELSIIIDYAFFEIYHGLSGGISWRLRIKALILTGKLQQLLASAERLDASTPTEARRPKTIHARLVTSLMRMGKCMGAERSIENLDRVIYPKLTPGHHRGGIPCRWVDIVCDYQETPIAVESNAMVTIAMRPTGARS
jgi:hypothetical protein